MKRLAAVILVGMLLFCAYIIPSPAVAATSEVSIALDREFLESNYQGNVTNYTYTPGNVFCSIDSQFTAQYVEVDLVAYDNCSWIVGVEPNFMRFDATGNQSFNLRFKVPNTAPNNTLDLITVKASWHLFYHMIPAKEQAGNATDTIVVQVIHIGHIVDNQNTPIVDTTQEPVQEKDSFRFYVGIASAFFILLVIVIVIIVYKVKSGKKKNKGKKGRKFHWMESI